MKKLTALLFLVLFSLSIFPQTPKKKSVTGSAVNSQTSNAVAGEKEELDRAVAVSDAVERLKALQKFVARFPKSAEKTRALELIVSARAETADEKMRAGDSAGGIAIFKLAVREAAAPVSDRLFADVMLQIPTSLFFRGERDAAAEIASAIEIKIAGNAEQTLGLATFYLGAENGGEAKRLAEKAVALNANLPAAYKMLGLANRLNFDLAEAERAYARALELDGNSAVSKRSLAEMKRALGKADEAALLYREVLEKNPDDALAASGLILALFNAGKAAEAESEMKKSLEKNPNNLTLLVGAAYSYAARGNAARAVELAQKAVALEPRYVWSYVALARGFLGQNRFFDAERALLAARAHGNFPTLDYELATVQAAGGFYREAAEWLARSFSVENDSVSVKLGGRIEKQSTSFTELVAFERRASIFEPLAADDAGNAERLKSLLDLHQKLESANSLSDGEIAGAAEKFVGGDDKMRLHRRLFVADYLLKKKRATSTVARLIKPAPAEIESALAVANPSSAVLADELYASRAITIAKNQLVVVPEVERRTLSNVLRGRIEEINGAVLLEDGKAVEAATRLRRALGILPEQSAWWRSSLWRLGAALEADGKTSEALTSYTKSYAGETVKSSAKRRVIELLYAKVNGNLDGLDAQIGAKSAAPETRLAAQNKTANSNATAEEKQTKSDAPPIERAETKPANQIKTPIASAKDDKKQTAAKPLFEPIIITVPKTDGADKPNEENKSSAAAGGQTKCEMTFSQPSVSLTSGGGSLGVLVGLDGDGDASEITAASQSGADLEVVFEPQTGATSNRAYFIFKSISRKTGAFTVVFEAPCGGKREFTVRVR